MEGHGDHGTELVGEKSRFQEGKSMDEPYKFIYETPLFLFDRISEDLVD